MTERWIIAALLALWFSATLIGQFLPRHPFRRHTLVRAALPVWRLFAPEPVDRDFHLLFRTWQRSVDQYGEWTEIPLLGDHTLAKSFFNPGRYAEKSLLTLSTGLIREYLGDDDFTQTEPYRTMLRVVLAHPAATTGDGLQFSLVESYGYHPLQEPTLIFASPLEEITPCS